MEVNPTLADQNMIPMKKIKRIAPYFEANKHLYAAF